MVRRRIVVLTIVGAILGGSVLGYRLWQQHLARMPLEWSGTVEARTIEVGSRVGGRVKEVLAREGDQVSQGQTLITLEPGDLEAQRLQAEGQLGQAQANLDKLSVRVGGARGKARLGGARAQEIAAARARLEAQEADLARAKLDVERNQQLLAGGASTRSDFDNSQIALRNAMAQRDGQKAQLDQLLQGTPDDVKAAQGQRDAAKGKLDQIETMIDELQIRAPRHARVETLDLRPGDILAPNQVAAKLLEPDYLYVRIYVPETELGYVHPGQELPLYVDTFPGRAFNAVVESVNHEGEFTPRNLQTIDERADQVFAARLRIETGKDVLRAGMAAFARVSR
jgi:multidrug resistance efflux pump